MTPKLQALRRVALALSVIYLPAFLPLLGVGPLRECPHCVETYLQWFPLVPTALPATLLQAGEWVSVVVALAMILGWVFALERLLRTVRIRGRILLVLGTASVSAFSALAFSQALRM